MNINDEPYQEYVTELLSTETEDHKRGSRMKNIYDTATQVGSILKEQGVMVMNSAHGLGEGPTPLRALCFLGGFALAVSSLFPLINIFSLVIHPSCYVLEFYLLLFGIACLAIESKDLRYLASLKLFCEEWCKFLTVPAGKGLFYIFAGTLAISLWQNFLLYLIVGSYLCLLGTVCILVHIGLRRSIERSGVLLETDDYNEIN